MLEQYGDILTVNEVQEILKINRKTVYRLLKVKSFSARRLARYTAYQNNLFAEYILGEEQ